MPTKIAERQETAKTASARSCQIPVLIITFGAGPAPGLNLPMATSQKDSLISIIAVFMPWRKHIVWATIGVFILTILLSLTMKNWYQGRTVFYAASQDLFKPEKIFGAGQGEMYYYGSGEDIDRILTVGNSNELIDYLIDSFNLWEVYEIKRGTSKERFKMRKAFRKNFKILLTKQDALELLVEDKDPERAAAIANAARSEIDNRVRDIIKNTQIALVDSYERAMKSKEMVMEAIRDSLVAVRLRTGIYDPGGQTELLATRITETTSMLERERATLRSLSAMSLSTKMRDTLKIIEARIVGLEREMDMLTTDDANALYSLKNFNASKGLVELLESRYYRAYEQIGYDLEKLKIYKAAVEIDVPALHLIEAAEVPLYKQRPRRSVIVLSATLAAFLFSLGAVLVLESWRRIDWKSLTAGTDNQTVVSGVKKNP